MSNQFEALKQVGLIFSGTPLLHFLKIGCKYNIVIYSQYFFKKHQKSSLQKMTNNLLS